MNFTVTFVISLLCIPTLYRMYTAGLCFQFARSCKNVSSKCNAVNSWYTPQVNWNITCQHLNTILERYILFDALGLWIELAFAVVFCIWCIKKILLHYCEEFKKKRANLQIATNMAQITFQQAIQENKELKSKLRRATLYSNGSSSKRLENYM